jgi:hypothetical protein
VLSAQEEIERLIFEDPDPDKGFMLHIDLKWVSVLPPTPVLFTSTDACTANGERQNWRRYAEVAVLVSLHLHCLFSNPPAHGLSEGEMLCIPAGSAAGGRSLLHRHCAQVATQLSHVVPL